LQHSKIHRIPLERSDLLFLQILSPIEEKKYRSRIVVFKSNKRKKPADIRVAKVRIIVSARGKGIRVSPHFYKGYQYPSNFHTLP
jgi:hypothetical protein